MYTRMYVCLFPFPPSFFPSSLSFRVQPKSSLLFFSLFRCMGDTLQYNTGGYHNTSTRYLGRYSLPHTHCIFSSSNLEDDQSNQVSNPEHACVPLLRCCQDHATTLILLCRLLSQHRHLPMKPQPLHRHPSPSLPQPQHPPPAHHS